MGFGPYSRALKIWESIWNSNSHNGSSLGSVRVHSLTLFALPGTCEVIPMPLSWLATLQPPCLGREPKARVMTHISKNSFNLGLRTTLQGGTLWYLALLKRVATRTSFILKITCNGFTSNEGKWIIWESILEINGISCTSSLPKAHEFSDTTSSTSSRKGTPIT